MVLTTSISNVLGIPMISAYAASKASLHSMTRSLARELLPRKIRVNAVSPGPIDIRGLGQPFVITNYANGAASEIAALAGAG